MVFGPTQILVGISKEPKKSSRVLDRTEMNKKMSELFKRVVQYSIKKRLDYSPDDYD